MWLMIWIVFSVLMLGFVAWTMLVLLQQKKAWKTFALKNDLNYNSDSMTASPSVQGRYQKRGFALYSDVQKTTDIRGQRYVSVVEIQLGDGMPTGGVVATSGLKVFTDQLIFDETIDVSVEGWDDSYIVRARDKANLKAYLTEPRAKFLSKIFKMKNATVLFFFDELESILRIETTDPLRDAERLQKIMDQIMAGVKILTPTTEERVTFKKLLKEEKKRLKNKHPDDEDEDEEDGAELNQEQNVSESEETSPKAETKTPKAKKKPTQRPKLKPRPKPKS